MNKKIFINQMTIGTTITNEPFGIKEFMGNHDGCFFIRLSDKSGSIQASIPKSLADRLDANVEFVEGTVLIVSGVVLVEGRFEVLKIKELSLCTDFVPAEIFPGISVKKIQECKKGITDLINSINHPGYKKLVECCLSEQSLDRMAELPATLSMYGRYNGACLVATNAVSHMVLTSMAAYSKRGNDLTTVPPSWNALTAASLLFLYGNVEFFTQEPPYKRTKLGVALGYTSLLQKMIIDVVHENQIDISDDDLAALLNILKVSTDSKSSVHATSKDGSILRHMISLYSDCDSFDWEVATHEPADELEQYYYSKNLKGYVIPQE